MVPRLSGAVRDGPTEPGMSPSGIVLARYNTLSAR